METQAAPQTQLTPDDAKFIIDTYRPIPEHFCTDVLGATPWYMQTEIIKAVFNYREVAVKTCNAVGKSYIAARIVVAFLSLYPGSVVVTTAPTWRQVKDILWREIATAVSQAKLHGYQLTKREVTQNGLEIASDWFAVGLSAKEPEKFFGYHSDFILVVIDEAGGVPEPIFRGVRAITPNATAHTLYIGNPTNPDGTFANAFKNPRVKKYTISAFDTPNLQQVGINNLDDLLRVFTPPEGIKPEDHKPFPDNFKWSIPGLISPMAVYDRYLEWGTDSPMWQALIMGEFPTAATNQLIPLDLIQAAMNYEPGKEDDDTPDDTLTDEQRLAKLDWDKNHKWNVQEGQLQYGVDVARFGDDRTVIAPRRGGFADQLIVFGKQATDITVDKVLANFDPKKSGTHIRVDDTGVGGGVTDQLLRRQNDNNESGFNEPWQYTVEGINFGSKAMDEEKFFNRRAEMFWFLRQQFYDRKISLPLDLKLANELACIRYSYTPKDNKIKIESKDDIKKRLGFSPDLADALAIAFAPSGAGVYDDTSALEAAARSQAREPEPMNAGRGMATDPTRNYTEGEGANLLEKVF